MELLFMKVCGLGGCYDFVVWLHLTTKFGAWHGFSPLFYWETLSIDTHGVACYFATNFKYPGRAACNLPAASPYCPSGSYGT
jgi:hypothetical protein